MMKRLEGRNLAHPGCLIGVTTGLTVGIILAGVLATLFNTPYGLLLLIWCGFTVGLGLLGWIWGAWITTRHMMREMKLQKAQEEQRAQNDLSALS